MLPHKIQILNTFLNELGIQEQYYRYLIERKAFVAMQRGVSEDYAAHEYKNWLRSTNPELYLQASFPWSSTEEGGPFWQSINKLWRVFLKTTSGQQYGI